MADRQEVRRRFFQTDDLIVGVTVNVVFPPECPDEACYDADTVEFMRQVHQHAVDRDFRWLKAHGVDVALRMNLSEAAASRDEREARRALEELVEQRFAGDVHRAKAS